MTRRVGIRTARWMGDPAVRLLSKDQDEPGPIAPGQLAHTDVADCLSEGGDDDPAVRILGPHGRLMSAVAEAAYADAGLDHLAPERVGLYVAMGMVDASARDLAPVLRASRDKDGTFDLERFYRRGHRSLHPLWPLSMLGNVAAGQIAIDLNIRGDNAMLASDGVGGMRAMLEGIHAVAEGNTDAALTLAVSESPGPIEQHRRWLEPDARHQHGRGAASWVATVADASSTFLFCGGGTGRMPSESADRREASWTRLLHRSGAVGDEALSRVIACTTSKTASAFALAKVGLGDVPVTGLDASYGPPNPMLALMAAHDVPAGSRVAVLTTGARGGIGALVMERAA